MHYEELRAQREEKELEDEEEVLKEEGKDGISLPQYILSYTQKRKLCRIHVRGGCWRKPGVDYKEY